MRQVTFRWPFGLKRRGWSPRTEPCPGCGHSYGYTWTPKIEEKLRELERNPVRDVPATTEHGVVPGGYLAVVCSRCRRCDFILREREPGVPVITGGRAWRLIDGRWQAVADARPLGVTPVDSVDS